MFLLVNASSSHLEETTTIDTRSINHLSMNRTEAEKFRDKQISQKYNLIHLLPTLNAPELSGLYLKSFLNATKRYQLQLPSLIEESDSKFCGSCGCVRIPKFNTEISIIEDSQARTLRYACLQCKHVANFPLELPSKDADLGQNSASEKFTATWPRKNPAADKVGKNSNSKARAKKRKMNSLSNLLSKKNEEKEKRTSSSLSLESFMQR